jgi:IS5 family transposase
VPLCREFTRLYPCIIHRIPDESTILRFRHLLEEDSLGAQILNCVNAQLAHAQVDWCMKFGTVERKPVVFEPNN